MLAWVALALVGFASLAQAQPSIERLLSASDAAARDDWDQVVREATLTLDDPQVSAADRAEAHRLLGLAAYHQQRLAAAETHFLTYLRHDLDGRLDPSLYPPELVGFFEGVRATHAAELRAARPRPRPRRAALLNLLPPAGQFQNQHRSKGWAIAGAGAGLLAANLISYAVLVRWCDEHDQTCEPGGESRSDAARTLAVINRASGIAAIAVYAYGVVDGFRHYRRVPTMSTGVTVSAWPTSTGAGVGIQARF